MTKKLLISECAATAIVFATTIASFTPKSLAYSNRYYCATLNGVPHTFVRHPRGEIAMIRWEPTKQWTAEERCTIVSGRFQAAADNALLKYIATGIVNDRPALCAVVNKGDRCTSNNLLLTLASNDRHEAARRLFDIQSLSSNGVVRIQDKSVEIETCINGECYFDVEAFEAVAPLVDKSKIGQIGQ